LIPGRTSGRQRPLLTGRLALLVAAIVILIGYRFALGEPPALVKRLRDFGLDFEHFGYSSYGASGDGSLAPSNVSCTSP